MPVAGLAAVGLPFGVEDVSLAQGSLAASCFGIGAGQCHEELLVVGQLGQVLTALLNADGPADLDAVGVDEGKMVFPINLVIEDVARTEVTVEKTSAVQACGKMGEGLYEDVPFFFLHPEGILNVVLVLGQQADEIVGGTEQPFPELDVRDGFRTFYSPFSQCERLEIGLLSFAGLINVLREIASERGGRIAFYAKGESVDLNGLQDISVTENLFALLLEMLFQVGEVFAQ